MSKRRTKKGPENPYRTAETVEMLAPTDRIAYEIVDDRRDLLPSVDRIMNAGLDDDAKLRAITLFRDSLGRAGDPHRDPQVSIANSTSSQAAQVTDIRPA